MTYARRIRPSTRRRDDRWITALKIVGVGAAVAAVIAVVVFVMRAHNARVNDCKSHGGKVTSKTSYHTTWVDGKRRTDSDTTYYCITSDRGIIDVW